MFGGWFFGIGWLVGLALLWGSTAWTAREKRLGLLIPVAEILIVVLLIASSSSGSGPVTFTVGDGIVWAVIASLVVAVLGLAAMLIRGLFEHSNAVHYPLPKE